VENRRPSRIEDGVALMTTGQRTVDPGIPGGNEPLRSILTDPQLLQAGAWLAGFYRSHPDRALRPPIRVRGTQNPRSDVPIPDWPYGTDKDSTARALATFVDAGLLQAVSSDAYRQTAEGRQLLVWFPLYHLRNLEVLPSRFPELGEAVRGRSVLDAGCGAGAYALLMRQLGAKTVVGLEYGPEVLAVARTFAAHTDGDVRFVLGSVESLPLKDGSVDFIFSRLVLPYVNQRPTIAEFSRVLSPGGQALLMLHGPGFYLRLLGKILSWPPPIRGAVRAVWGLIGGGSLQLLGRQLKSWPLSGRRPLSYQRPGMFGRLLDERGLQVEFWERGTPKPYVWVRKPRGARTT